MPYSEFVKTPESEWNDIVDDYLVIGSDYAAGIVYLGIKKYDLSKENPPVYMYHETNSIEKWDMLYNNLYEYLLTVVCDALFCKIYGTAERILKKYKWNYKKYFYKEFSDDFRIDINNLNRFHSFYSENEKDWFSCCYDTDNNMLFLLWHNGYEMEITVISNL